MAIQAWQEDIKECQSIQENSVNKEWLLPADKVPSAEQLNVIDVPKTCGLLTAKELEITETSAGDMVKKMAAGEWTATEVVTSFLKRATIGQQLLNFATEFMTEDALTRAAELDAHFKTTGKIVGPLHGVPISVKEHVGIKGRICHTGYVAWVKNIAPEDALLVKLLKNAGAIFHVRTNEPQSLMHLDCTNNIHGTTVNPWNRKLSPGGSSGGEGASLGFKCAALGIGTDIGGSIRAPAAFCGSYGFRPTALRNPYKGVILAGDGQESIKCVIGPLSNSLSDIELFQSTVLDQEPWDEETSLVPLPWKEVTPAKEFTVGILRDDGIVRPHPPITRGLEHAAQVLKAAGVKVVEWEPVDHSVGWEIVKPLYFPDAGACQRSILEESGEPIMPLTQWALDYGRQLTVTENWDLNVQREEYRARYHAAMKERGVDFILCPTYVGVAAELGTPQYWVYTAIWNILDQPAVIFPSGLHVDQELDKIETDYKPRSDVDKREYERYAPEKFVDAPIAYQLVGKHYKDEETIAAAKVIEEILKKA
ncbi:fatty-acid amide hydrolase [Coleophoma cylindrospora]|uniref:amidase n=1 Tax=Coleophoma cylindrospora TaxID=1849047 RepID=A0A3D8QDS3_9HELO|nr:fatty-acid amide hydrolase [Coleophoma cylindrospora]